MQLTQAQKTKPNWPTLIRRHRKALRLSQKQFGAMFGVGAVAVCRWESGKREAPYDVTWWIYMRAARK